MLTLKLTEVTTSTQTCNTKEKGMKMTGKLCFVMVLVICSNYAYKGKNEYLYHCKQSNFFKMLFVAKNIDTCSEYTVDCQSKDLMDIYDLTNISDHPFTPMTSI